MIFSMRNLRSIAVWLLLLALALPVLARPPPRLSANYNASAISELSSVNPALQVPLTTPKHSEVVTHTPLNEKYNIQRLRGGKPEVEGLEGKMVHIDYEMLYEQLPPRVVLEERHSEEYMLLENREFHLLMTNPSEIFTICINEIFSDCQSIKKATKRPLPFCLNPLTKYPIHFNLYVTSIRSREVIKAGIYFNVTIKYDARTVFNRVWLKQVKFTLLPNHLKLYPFELKNCKAEPSQIAIKNPQKIDLSFILIYKYKKYYLNGQPLDDKFTINSQKTFKFQIEGRDSTMTVYSQPASGSTDRNYPVLYVPVYCLEPLVVENVPIGIISAQNLALIYPILVTSHTSSLIAIEEIQVNSSSATVDLIRYPTHKSFVQPNQRFIQIASMVVRSARNPQFRNSLTLRIRYSMGGGQNGSEWGETVRVISYCEMYGPIQVGGNRLYDVNLLGDGDYNETEKITHYNYSVVNKLQIPVRMERVLFNSNNFRMHWYRYNGLYIFPDRVKSEILLEYTGTRQLPISPAKFIAAIEFSGGIFVPFEVMVFDNTLACIYQGKQHRCSSLKYINFGHKNDTRIQTQVITFRNLNPNLITLGMLPLPPNASRTSMQLTAKFGEPFPIYQSHSYQSNQQTFFRLRSGHCVNLTIEMRSRGKPQSGEIPLILQTAYQAITPKIKLNFQQGKLLFEPEIYVVKKWDRPHRGELIFSSTFQQSYQIRQITADTNKLEFTFNESSECQQNTKVAIPFLYEPHRQDHNLTEECCNEEFLKTRYLPALLSHDEHTPSVHTVTLITSTDQERKMKVHVENMQERLLAAKGEKFGGDLSLKVLKQWETRVELRLRNPYPTTMKYSVFMLPQQVVAKPKDYLNYFKYARKQKAQAFFCFSTHIKNFAFLTTNTLRQMFRLDDKPLQIVVTRNSVGGIQLETGEKENLSFNEYLNSVVKTGQESCYRMSTTLYNKLLIESQILNQLVEDQSIDVVEKFMEKENQHVQDASITIFHDDFYSQLKLPFSDYCHSAFFPIFRFCLHRSLQLLPPHDSLPDHKRPRRTHKPTSYLLPSGQEQTLWLNVGEGQRSLGFHLVIANNFSAHDGYKVQVEMIEPKISIGDIAFEENHKINNDIFIKHYFPGLAKLPPSQLLHQTGLSRHKIIPLYLTNQDYDEEFGLFKGHRYFEISNQAPIDITFTHFGLQDRENISEFSGLRIQQVGGNGENGIVVGGQSRTTFGVNFNIQASNYGFNLSNPLYHQKVNLYLYKSNEYHIELHLLIKVADNVVSKLKQLEKHNQGQSSQLGYILINFLSVGFIFAVIVLFKREEKEKNEKMQLAIEKQKKINVKGRQKKQQLSNDDTTYTFSLKRSVILSPQAIGTPLPHLEDYRKYKIVCTLSQQDTAYFKSLKLKEDKSIVSESSQSEAFLRYSQDDERLKTQEEQKSIKSHQKQRDESRHSAEDTNSQLGFTVVDPENEEESESEESELSLSESFLPDGISVCNEQLEDIDAYFDDEYGFENKQPMKKEEQRQKTKQEEFGYYNVFSNNNPLKKENSKGNPFPWMPQNERKKPKTKRTKE